MDKEGYIKFDCKWIKSDPIPAEELIEINQCRGKLYNLGLIGVYSNGIGFGNISTRVGDSNNFIITGSATGNLKSLNEKHYTRVTDFNFKKNSLICKGPIKASSESLSHAAVYSVNPEAGAVIHIHNLNFWEKLIDNVPTTLRNVEYGTPEMAEGIERLFKDTDVKNEKILVMGGHKEGIISFGKDLREAYNKIYKLIV